LLIFGAVKSIGRYITLFLKGMGMGSADVVPGVSGGTIAFITGIYEQLIASINAIDGTSIKFLFTGKWVQLAQRIHLQFLIPLFIGIVAAILSLARLIEFLLQNYQEGLWGFFFGLILASAWMIRKQVGSWRSAPVLAALAGGVLVAYSIVSMGFLKTPNTLPYIFGSGFIAIVAMILPGISGSFILLILDKYSYVIGLVSGLSDHLPHFVSAVASGNTDKAMLVLSEMHLLVILTFVIGCVLGLLFFAKILNWLLKHFYDITMALLTGFLLGSLYKVWPWKQTITWHMNRHGEKEPLLQENILPQTFDAYFFMVVILAILGFAIVFLVDRFANERA